jgi:hypothetical protein
MQKSAVYKLNKEHMNQFVETAIKISSHGKTASTKHLTDLAKGLPLCDEAAKQLSDDADKGEITFGHPDFSDIAVSFRYTHQCVGVVSCTHMSILT